MDPQHTPPDPLSPSPRLSSGDSEFPNYREKISSAPPAPSRPSTPVSARAPASAPAPSNLPIGAHAPIARPVPSPFLQSTPVSGSSAPLVAPTPIAPSPRAIPIPSNPPRKPLPVSPKPLVSNLPPLPPLTRPELAVDRTDQAPVTSTFIGAGPAMPLSPSDLASTAVGSPVPASRFAGLPPQSREFRSRAPARHHPLKVIGIILAVVIVLGAGAYGVYAALLSPDRVLPPALASIDSSPQIRSTLVVAIDSDDKQINGSSLMVTNSLDRTDASSPVDDASITLSLAGIAASGEIRLINGILYGELTQVPPAYAAQYATYANRWYSVSLATLSSMSSSTSQISMPKAISLTETYARLVQSGVLSNISLAGVGISQGQPVRTYSITVDKDALARYLSSTMASGIASALLANVDFSPLTITTDLISGVLRSFAWNVTVKSPATAYAPALSAVIHLSGTYDGASASFTVAEPTGASPLDGYFTKSLASTQAIDKNSRITSDVQQVRVALEMSYRNGRYADTCQSANESLIAADVQASGSTVICHLNDISYSIAAKLLPTAATSSASYYCIDSNGKVATLLKPPSGTACK